MAYDIVLNALIAGIYALIDYLSAHVLTCLVPAFFIAGAMAAFVQKEKIVAYLGKNTPKYKAYPLAVVAGLLLAVCSCTILPLFAGIKKKGAGIGPAIAFLYTAPATNLLAIVFTGSVLGWDFAFARIILSVTFAIVIGMIISRLFVEKDEEGKNQISPPAAKERKGKRKPDGEDMPLPKRLADMFRQHHLLLFFATLFSIMMVGALKFEIPVKAFGMVSLILLLLAEIRLFFKRDEIKSWLKETWFFFKMIFPLLLAGIFAAGVLTALIPENLLAGYFGANTVFANLGAALFGVFMYFPTLVEVPMAKMFLGLGMAKGPLLAYILADPVISLPSILVVRRIMGTKRTLVYAVLILVFCTLSGLIYGFLWG
jgi:uncharacterized membrane protein YraQ (UPF0718 family)